MPSERQPQPILRANDNDEETTNNDDDKDSVIIVNSADEERRRNKSGTSSGVVNNNTLAADCRRRPRTNAAHHDRHRSPTSHDGVRRSHRHIAPSDDHSSLSNVTPRRRKWRVVKRHDRRRPSSATTTPTRSRRRSPEGTRRKKRSRSRSVERVVERVLSHARRRYTGSNEDAAKETTPSPTPPPPAYHEREPGLVEATWWRTQLQPLTTGDCALDFVHLVEPILLLMLQQQSDDSSSATPAATLRWGHRLPHPDLVPLAFNLSPAIIHVDSDNNNDTNLMETAVRIAHRYVPADTNNNSTAAAAPVVCFAALSLAFGWPPMRAEVYPVLLQLAALCRARRLHVPLRRTLMMTYYNGGGNNNDDDDGDDIILMTSLAPRRRAALAASAVAAQARLQEVADGGGDVRVAASGMVRQPVPLDALGDVRRAAALLYAVDVQLGPVALSRVILYLVDARYYLTSS